MPTRTKRTVVGYVFFCCSKIVHKFCEIKNALKIHIISQFPDLCRKFDISDGRFPAVICASCQRKLYKVCTVARVDSLKIPDGYKNYPALKNVINRSKTMQNGGACEICKILLNYGVVRNNLLKKPIKKLAARNID